MSRTPLVVVVSLGVVGACGAQNLGASYKWELPADQVQSFESAQFEHGCLSISFEKGHCIPIVTEVGVTGMTVVAPGQMTMKLGDNEPVIDSAVHAVMLRYNPADKDHVFATESPQPVEDPGLVAMANSLTMGVFRHCWHRGWEALIPPAGSATVACYAKGPGDAMAWDNGTEYGAYSFTTKTELAKGTH